MTVDVEQLLLQNRVDKRTRKDRTAWKEPSSWVCSGYCGKTITKSDTFSSHDRPVRICKKCHMINSSNRQKKVVTGQLGIEAVVKRRVGNGKCNARRDGHIHCTTYIKILVEKFTTECMICSTDVGLNICLDHCHKTGKFRGWVCNRCNSTLRDNTTIDDLYKIIAYLKENTDESGS